MPSESVETPAFTLKRNKYTGRNRTWSHTSGYGSVPDRDLPVNPYSDFREVDVSQNDAEAWTLTSSGSFTQVTPKGPYYTGATLRDIWASHYAASGFSAFANRVQNDAIVRLLGKVADSKFNFGVMAAEARKSVNMIVETATRVHNAYRAFRRGRFGEVARHLKLRRADVHDNWLAYKYGWMPLLMEVKGVADFYGQQVVSGGRPLSFSVEVSGSEPFVYRTTEPFTWFGGGQTGVWTVSLTGAYQYRLKAWVEVINPHLATQQQAGITNPALVAWELVPYSFVFDWFYSVGAYLQAQSALHGVTLRKTMQSNCNILTLQVSRPTTSQVVSGTTYFSNESKLGYSIRNYGRGTLSIDPLSLSVPRNNSLSLTWQQGLSALALLRGANRGVHRI